MTKQTKVALAVLAFVVTATVARRVGQFEMKDQAEKQIAVLQERVAKAQADEESWRQSYINQAKHDSKYGPGEDPLSVAMGIAQGVKEYRECRQGDRDSCNHVMLMSDDPNKDILYNAQGNYKKNAFQLFERMGGKQ